ncbi:DUF6994 family protein [Macrococcus equi]|uniref:DUF6994 family protein n=1 Tax=Macrococcus equi TaxID=3395462 RepID=UPI0039BDBA7B
MSIIANGFNMYKENYLRFKQILESDYGRQVLKKKGNENYYKRVIDALNDDPDLYDRQLYEFMKEYYNQAQIREKYKIYKLTLPNKKSDIFLLDNETILGLDCIISWRKLYDYHNGDDKWVEDYKEIRNSPKSHLIFPRHRNSLNICRSRSYNDRIDLTLQELKGFYTELEMNNGNLSEDFLMNSPFSTAYNNEITFKWLKSFKSFIGYCITNRLDDLIRIENEIVYVRDLSEDYKLNKILDGKANSYSKNVGKEYVNNIKKFVDGEL